jgi:uncharacterized protein (DUF488 family)
MRLFARQKLLLGLLEASGGSLGATDFQKLLFLYTQKWEEEPSFKFVPYRFGCFSFQSYADRKTLTDKGMIKSDETGAWQLSSKAKPYLDRDMVKRLRVFVERTAPERGDALIRRVYREFPYFASRSEVVNRVIRNTDEREQILKATPKAKGRALMTIGYEGDSIDGYLDRLIRHGVRLLCDVRRNPLSRKTGFSKNQLASYCERVGIEYCHLPELGIPGHRRRELNTQADYDALFEEYEAEDLPEAGEAITKLGRLLRKHSRVALTCFEKEPESCHRHCVAEEMERKLEFCPAPLHI